MIGVVGGGLGGLAAACTLAGRGAKVTVFERNAWVGGKAAEWSADGYRFDMGPTILMMPSVLRRVFAEGGRALEDALDLVELDPQWRCFYEDGATLDLHRRAADTQRAAEALAPGSGAELAAFQEFSERLARLSDRYFFYRSVGGMSDLLRACGPATLVDLLKLKPGTTVAGQIRKRVSDARVAQMLDHFTQYVGSAPDASPAVLCGIAHMQTDEGVWYPRGGIRAIAEALAEQARSLGVELRTDAHVVGLRLEGRRVVGIELEGGETVAVEGAVCNADVVRADRELLPPPGQRLAGGDPEPACSGVVLYLGLKRRYPQLLHHNFVFSQDPHAEFEAIYRRGEPAADPTCYVCAPAQTDPDVAPEGGEALYVLVHTPYLREGQDWRQELPGYRRVILDKLERVAGLEGIEDAIVCERALTPQDIHERYRVHRGAIYGLASHGRWFGAFKPGNRSPRVDNLTYAGGSVHPGPGMPMALMSGWIAADGLVAAPTTPQLAVSAAH